MNLVLFYSLLFMFIGLWWSNYLESVIIKEEIDINGFNTGEKVLHTILWPLSSGIFIIRFITVFFTDVNE